MTIALNLVTVAESIAALDVPGVTFYHIDRIPESAITNLPVFFPVPNGYVTEMTFTRQSQGADTVAAMDVTYTLHYRYLHAVVGSGGGLLSVYAGMIENIVLILEKIFANSNLSGAVDVQLQEVSNIGVLTDPSGTNQFHGVDIALKVLEFVQ